MGDARKSKVNGYETKKEFDRLSQTSGPQLVEEDTSCKAKTLRFLKSNLMLFLLVLGMVLGIVMGLCIRQYHPDFGNDARKTMYLDFPGKLFMRMLKMTILPLILSSLVAGMAALPSQAAGKLGGRAVLYYMLTTLLAVLLGILLVCTIQPGSRGRTIESWEEKKSLVEPADAILDLVRNCFPDNLIKATFKQAKTSYTTTTMMRYEEVNETELNITSMLNVTSMVNKSIEYEEKTGFKVTEGDGTNVLGIVVFSICLGLIIGNMGEKGKPLKDFFESMQEAIIRIVGLIIWFAPVGIAFLLAARIVRMDDPAQRFLELGYYMMTVLLGLFIHAFILLPLIFFIFTRTNPFRLLYNMMEAILTALGTASSSATLPITLRCLIEKQGVDDRVAHFMLPVGATINMDGTALYEAVATIFIAQYLNYSLNVGQVIVVSITATAAAIGAAGVPEAGLVTMAIVLTAVGLPVEEAGLIYAIDWFLDRFRTAVNVWGDSIGAATVAHLSRKDLVKMDEAENGGTPGADEKATVYGVKNSAYVPEDNTGNTTAL